jgi:hypothetical protein
MNNIIYYRKNKNGNIFNSLEKSIFQVNNIQNYIPIYDNFFSFHDTNYKNINLNNTYYLAEINQFYDKNNMEAIVSDNSNNKLTRNVFCKFSPLLDPLKYLTGKYDSSDNSLLLPTISINSNLSELYTLAKSSAKLKIEDKNNSAYVDGFFSYLSSLLLNNFGMTNAIDFYGSYLCNQSKFLYDIADDIDYLDESDFFHQEKLSLYEMDSEIYSSIFNTYSRSNKTKLTILEKTDTLNIDNISEILDISDSSNVYKGSDPQYSELTINNIELHDNSISIVDFSDVSIYKQSSNAIQNIKPKSHSNSSCSSNSSHTTNTDDDGGDDDGGDDDGGDDSTEYETIDDDSDDDSEVMCHIYNFPVELIAIEKCTNTLDSLMSDNNLSDKEWCSCLFQIILTLTTFQRVFAFTHNDLHTNNIMYIETEKKFLYYKFNNIYYKVPTYGKIYKIIDFGRSIYKFQGKIMCSDSFHPKGDAGSQYNCEPYFDGSKPRLEPNYSFDLCRLACCLFDDFVDDIIELPHLLKENKILSLIYTWLIDDKKRNILYKTNGEERYPEFKLYKMIARTIHGAIPSEQLNHEIFADYVINKKKINRKQHIINIDNIPCLM